MCQQSRLQPTTEQDWSIQTLFLYKNSFRMEPSQWLNCELWLCWGLQISPRVARLTSLSHPAATIPFLGLSSVFNTDTEQTIKARGNEARVRSKHFQSRQRKWSGNNSRRVFFAQLSDSIYYSQPRDYTENNYVSFFSIPLFKLTILLLLEFPSHASATLK